MFVFYSPIVQVNQLPFWPFLFLAFLSWDFTTLPLIFNMILMDKHQGTFDFAALDNMRRLVEHAGRPGHIYPLALLCYDIMPPPAQVTSYCFLLSSLFDCEFLFIQELALSPSLCRLKRKLGRKE